MKKKIIDIRTDHTFSDYRRYFGSEYDRGELSSFKIEHYERLRPDRQYWKLKNNRKVYRYYELPKHVKPFTEFSPYSFNRVFHRRPARTALLILGCLTVACISCNFIGLKVFGTKDFNIVVNPLDLEKCAINYQQWISGKDPKKDDISKDPKISIAGIAGMAMGNFLYEANAEKAKLRDNVLTVGHGHSDTNIIISHVLVDISNNFQQIKNKQLEESISYGTMSLTRFAKRDYFDGDNTVEAYHGDVLSSSTANWKDELINKYTKEEYMNLVGKNPAQPFLYNITDETVLTDKVYDEDENGNKHFGNSSCVAIKDSKGNITGYNIELDLHNVKSVTRYIKRMTYLSGQTPSRFNSVHMSFVTDENLMLIKSYVKEKYIVTMMDSEGWFDTRYYVGENKTQISEISKKLESFDYSKYQF